MPRKIDLITELYRRTIKGITSDSVAWRALLHSAAYQYKYPFADQVLIYAQRPKATACAELELWNKHFDRWVKRGATGIALIAGNPNGGKMYLNHVFDVADTHHREDKPFKLWSVSPSFEEDVVEALENRFGDLGKKNSFTDAVISACINLGQDNLHDYLRELEYSTEGSFLEELDEDNLRYRLQLTVQASVAYTVLSRLGYDADIYVGAEAFEWVHEFNTPATVNILGNATGDISEICLREIEKTVKSIERSMQKENRIFDGSGENRYNDGGKEPTEQNNGGNDYGNHLQNGERREAAEPQPARADRLPDREVWTDEIEFYEEPSQGDLHDTSDRGQAERISARDGADGAEQAFGDYIPDGTEPWGNGGAESDQPNEVGADDEQHQELGGGGNSEQSDLRISAEDELYAYEGKGIAPQYLDTEISGGLPPPSEETLVLALRHGDYLHKSKLSIVSFLMTESDPQKKVDYVKKAYEMGLTGEFFRPGTEEHIGYHVEPKGLVIYEGNYPTHKTEAKFSWELVIDLIEALMKEGRYLDDAREGQQLSFMDVAEPTVEREALVTVESINDRQQSTQAEKSLINEDFGDTEYNLTLGATVHIGKDEMEILSLSAEKVELFDGTLIPYELPTDVFLTRLRENPLNDALLKEPKAISTSVITEQKKEPKKTKKRKDKEPTMESLAASITETYERWNFYLNGGGSDPTWEDGGNMNLLRNHILYYRRQMEDICKDGNFPEIYYRELPPEMPMKYMAQPEKIREDARRALALYKANPTYQWCRENLSRIPEKELKKSTIPAIMGYVSGLEKFIEQDKLVDMRRHCNPNYYMESFDSCRKQMETILERVSRDELTDSIFDSLMNESEQDEEVQDEIDFAETEPEGAEEEKPLSLFEKYEHLKEKYPGFILAVRVGDFYEFFDESAKIVSEQLGLTLTSRSFPDGNRYPMCGVPQHRKDEFFGKLIEAKYSIACYDEDGEVLIEPASVTEETREVDAELDSLPISTAIDGEVRTFPNEDAMLEAMGTAPMPTMQEKPKEKVSLPVYHAHPDIPDSKKHNYRITDNEIGMGGAKEKFRKNIAAINFLHELEAQNRLATPEEQEVLAQYSGWGGLADAFDETKDHWHSEFTELYTTLSPEEYEAAKESTLTAFYTPPVIIKAMYKALENMGFKRGNILEPSCGVGNFMGLVPEGMDAKMYGVELDSLSGRIARQLYQKNGITIDGYEKTQFPDSFFDVAIGNVPFNDFKLLDKKYDKYNFLIHDYFFGATRS